MPFNYASCPLTPALRSAIEEAESLTLIAQIRPTWGNDRERFSFGALSSDPERSAQDGIVLDCQSNRTFDLQYNAIGCSWRYGSDSFAGAAQAPSSETPGSWLWIAATVDVASDPQTMRLFDRLTAVDPWNLRREYEGPAGPSTFFLRADADCLYAGNRMTFFVPEPEPVAERWPGGIASVSLRVGMAGDGSPGGTEIAEWHPTPPVPTYTDPYGNVWTITGPSWQWATVS